MNSEMKVQLPSILHRYDMKFLSSSDYVTGILSLQNSGAYCTHDKMTLEII